jgi:hypothetical protein
MGYGLADHFALQLNSEVVSRATGVFLGIAPS